MEKEMLPQEPKHEPSPSVEKDKKVTIESVMVVLLIILLATCGAVAYWHRDQAAKKQQKQQAAAIVALQAQLADHVDMAADTVADTPTPVVTTDKTENIIAAIKSDNTAALEGYMAPKVHVIIAATEGIGDRTPAQAIGDLNYIKDATDPWNFAPPSSTLDRYRAGDYAQFFPVGAIVGKSADDRVVSFTFDSDGKINGIFMSSKESLLIP